MCVMNLSIVCVRHSIQNAERPSPVVCNVLLFYQNLNNINSCKAAVCKNVFQACSSTVCAYMASLQACKPVWGNVVKKLWEPPTIQQTVLLLQPDISYSFGQAVETVLSPSIRESLLPKPYGKAQIFIHYQPANQRSQQQHEHN
jgi:hypothetical protein